MPVLGFACADTFKAVEAVVGTQKARLVAQAQTAATSWVEGVVKTEGIDCGFSRMPCFVFEAGKERASNLIYQVCCAVPYLPGVLCLIYQVCCAALCLTYQVCCAVPYLPGVLCSAVKFLRS